MYIRNAIESVYSKDGVIVLTDIGSSTLTSEIGIEDLNKDNILLFDGPIVESAIAASVSSECGNDINAIRKLILTNANKQAPWKVKSAIITRIENANTGEVVYGDEEKTDYDEKKYLIKNF